MAGVYLSFPFCSQKCTFCNFASGVFPKAMEAGYSAALLHEISAKQWEWTPETVYLGGGTPSQMDVADLTGVLDALPGRPWREATIEAAPGSLTVERIRAWRAAGINRVSLGVQSFVSRELTQTGRKHNADVVAADCELLRVHGIENINIDLIAGLPFQTHATWNESLDWIEKLAVPHVSVYMLEVDEDSRLGLQILDGGSKYGARQAPSDDLTAEMYVAAVERLASFGIFRYEISNFARPGFESLHNLKYWLLEPYAGFGVDAHSFDGAVRWGNVDSVEDYVDRWKSGRPLHGEPESAKLDEERFFVGLRLSRGIEPRPEDWVRFAKTIERFIDSGLLEISDSRLRLTSHGILLSNDVFQEFLLA